MENVFPLDQKSTKLFQQNDENDKVINTLSNNFTILCYKLYILL